MVERKDKVVATESFQFEGEFELLPNSDLAFIPANPKDFSEELNQDHKLIFQGTWFVDENHDLRFQVQRSTTGRFGKELVFKGEFLKAEAGELDFTYRFRVKEGKVSIRTLRFFGKWEADQKNRLTFTLNRSLGRTEALTLNGAWRINKRYQIIYTYRKEQLKTKKKTQKRLAFRGYWDIAKKRRISYVLEGDSSQAFRFRVTYATPIILAKQKEIRFQIGIEVTGRRRSALREIVLFGKWKLKRDFSLSFEVKYRKGVWHSLQFDAKYKINDRYEIEADLSIKNGEGVGASLTLSRNFIASEGDAFLRLEHSLGETRVEAGVRIPL